MYGIVEFNVPLNTL